MESIAVCLVTYNQEKYIAQAIESVLFQKVSIPFEIYIGEDYSSDNTRIICLDYEHENPGTIKVILNNENQGLVKNTISVLREILKNGHDYIAMLDGDDYWSDDFKLQKELDFFRSHPDYGLVHTNIAVLKNDNELEFNLRRNVPVGNVKDMINQFAIGNCSVLFRTSLLEYINLNDFIVWKFMSVDYAMYTIFAQFTKFGFLPDCTAVWRRGHTSISNTNEKDKQIDYIENELRIWHYLSTLPFPNFIWNESEAVKFRNWRIFNIAFRFKDFELARSISTNSAFFFKKNDLRFFIKKKVARNRFLFNIWCSLKDSKDY